ncbi:hypothetical protein HZC30_01365 [Candidatus Woesearchaeota archaeon]|nr:hypothetical protein [Candidatus Woesearchaeota archaeon]
MGILFKTYNSQHQLHVCREVWQVENKVQLEEALSIFPKKEVAKAKITPTEKAIEIELNTLIVPCRDLDDLKKKFGILADLKMKYQKLVPQVPAQKPKPEQKK